MSVRPNIPVASISDSFYQGKEEAHCLKIFVNENKKKS